MKKLSQRSLLFTAILLVISGVTFSQSNKVVLNVDAAKDTISRHIYGHFSEHLGRCIYGGIWVGEDSKIPNTRGIRNDVVAALKNIKVANLRWPGGCFADEYHWKDGIGPRDQRPKMVNTNWGGVVEDNSFGTHEFMDLCEQLGTEPVICGNLGSGTVQELSDWVTYLTSSAENPMTELRKKNGREKPWKVKFWCVGNESWGCGGVMDPEFYSNEMAKYSWFMRNNPGNTLFKIASGGLEADYNWTDIVMKKWDSHGEWLKTYMSGYSLHYYTVTHNWDKKGSAINFNEDDWILTLTKTLRMDTLVTEHSKVMDKYDPQKRVGLIVDEWGAWHDVEPGTNPGFLYQQNSLRDAMVAALNLNIFHKHADRVKMANIAQIVNVLQSVILTQDDKMVLTPTYHLFDLYKVHQDAVNIPLDITSESYENNGLSIPAISATASKSKDGSIHISLVNTNPDKEIAVPVELKGLNGKKVTGRVLTSANMQDHNTFDNPDKVKLADFTGFKVNGDELTVTMPSKSIITLEVK